jgi:predicted transcriptional regulator
MRKKTQSPLASTDITAAWARVFEDAKIDDIEQLHSEGWRSVYEIAKESGRIRNTIAAALDSEVRAGRFEKKLAKIKRGTQTKQICFYRPIAK